MMLSDLAKGAGISVAENCGDAEVSGFAIDNRKVAPGTVFGAFKGAKVNGEDFIPAAIKAGAVAVVARKEAKVEGAVHIASDEPRRTFALLAAQYFHPVPSTIVAITGTNGKTSCAELTRQLWNMAGNRAASIGTLGVTTADGSVSTGLTTPDIVTFLSNMSGLSREGISHAAYEASSHGLHQYRCEGVRLRAAALTNLSRDHLDYHGDMEAYFTAKMRLFDEVLADDGVAAIWQSGDEWSSRAVAHAEKRGIKTITVGTGEQCTLRLLSRTPTKLGQDLEISFEGANYTVKLPLIGAYQSANALVSAGLVIACGADAAATFDALSRVQGVAGRLQRAALTHTGAPVYVDYAHTPDALVAALEALRPHANGRLICVFGAGGDRDNGKRAPMGAAVSEFADIGIVTDDNPRGEDARQIRAQVLSGATKAMEEIGDRRAAILRASELAEADDIVLIAGKGHEKGQIIGSGETMKILPFDDVAVAGECAAEAARKKGVSAL